MNKVFLIINADTKEVLAIYDTKRVAEKLKEQIAEKFNASDVVIEERTVNLRFGDLGVRK